MLETDSDSRSTSKAYIPRLGLFVHQFSLNFVAILYHKNSAVDVQNTCKTLDAIVAAACQLSYQIRASISDMFSKAFMSGDDLAYISHPHFDN